jgi:hypothetical protein
VNPIFDEREKCGEFHTLFPMLLHCTSHSGVRPSVRSYTKEIDFSVSTIFFVCFKDDLDIEGGTQAEDV